MIERQIKQYRRLNEWFQLPLGQSIAQEFTSELQPVREYLKGDTLLQMGHCGENTWLQSLDYQHKWVASPFALDSKIQLQCSLNQIPLARNSLDCIIMPLSLEPFGNNLSLIDEVDRVLKPTGFLIFLSINPWSLWGGAMKLGLLDCYQDHKIKMRSAFSLNRILLQRGYRQCSLINFCYIPPVKNKSIIKKMTVLDEVGKMLWPIPSGFYCYIAQKYQLIQPSLTPLPVQQPVTQEYKSPLQPALNKDFLR